MRVIYKGYAITTYGKDRVSITDPDGREIYSNRPFTITDEKELKQFLKDFIKDR
jgi:hypothetical protein